MKLPEIIHDSWYPLFTQDVREVIEQIRLQLHHGIAPAGPSVFRAFQLPLGRVKVVMMGLAPYQRVIKGEMLANGLAFGIDNRDYWTPSLEILEQSLIYEYKLEDRRPLYESLEMHNMTYWWRQGILPLNAAMSVNQNGSANDHVAIWRPFWVKMLPKIAKHATVMATFGSVPRTLVQGLGLTAMHFCHPVATHRAIDGFHNKWSPDMGVEFNLNLPKQEPFTRINKALAEWNLQDIAWFEGYYDLQEEDREQTTDVWTLF